MEIISCTYRVGWFSAGAGFSDRWNTRDFTAEQDARDFIATQQAKHPERAFQFTRVTVEKMEG